MNLPNVLKSYNYLNLFNIHGGGGGSRTRVRKHSTQASTYLSRKLGFMFLVSSRQDTRSTSLLRFRRYCHRQSESTILLVDARAGCAGKTRRGAGLIMRPGHIHNRLRLCLKPHRIYERTGRSVCSSSFFIPVEAVSPPNRINRKSKFRISKSEKIRKGM